MTLEQLNALPLNDLQQALKNCCGASSWINKMISYFPSRNEDELFRAARDAWQECNESDWLEAFQHHPKIGDVKSLHQKFASTAAWASGEQSSVKEANEIVIEELSKQNKAYEDKFGFIFIVCATGKSAGEMLGLLNDRIHNERHTELQIAAAEQEKITLLRLKKILS